MSRSGNVTKAVVRPSRLQRFRSRLQKRLKSLDFRFRRWFGAKTIRSLYGPRFQTNFGDATFRLYIKASYGRFYWDHLQAVKHEFVFLDIGANQGLYTIGAAQNPHSRQCFAFEPVPAVASLLTQNLSLNQVSDKCQICEVAVSEESGQTLISLPENHSGGASLRQDGSGASETLKITTICAADLAEIVPREEWPVRIKIDVEGHEEVVIRELLKSHFADRIEEIFYEVDERWVNPQEVKSLLIDLGFQLDQVGEGSHYDVLATRILNRNE
ncbi:MAG: FkbM family methyltransferase [Planctomycetes bacterium]|nr:FkbM family methyltransferase [Planctomycetota bacterium]